MLPNTRTILQEIVHECRNGCTDERAAWDQFKRAFKLSDQELRELMPLLRCINYAAVRENEDRLVNLLKRLG